MEGVFHEDLAALSDLDEQSLLESLSQRFKQDRIYVSINSDLKCACDCFGESNVLSEQCPIVLYANPIQFI